ncbi:MAG: helix-turn-helix domain-containing protein [Planctomycetes bacterium]|nr:helix-turn-helix domain-containing protein [Planctomycetota bacterium]
MAHPNPETPPTKDLEPLLALVGSRVRALRQAQGWTLRRLAEAAELSPRFVSQLEAGQGNIAIGRLAGVARALEVPLERLVASERNPSRVALDALLSGRTPSELRRALEAVEATLAERPLLIALLGMRGAGKSTLGAAAARALGLPFVELDDRIEAAAGLSLGELFALHGEPFVRRLEGKCLEELTTSGQPAVVALTGGVVANSDALAILKRHALTVWLEATPEDHMQRVLDQGDRRPMAESEDAMSELRALLAAREPRYREADVRLDTSAAASREAALAALIEALGEAGWPSA